MLIDQNGFIVFKGHPATRKNLEQDLNDLMNGKELSGEGAEAPQLGNSGEAEVPAFKVPEGYAEMDNDTVNQDVANFRTAMDELVKDD